MMIRYRNPILPGFYPDPSICRVGDDYYLITSTFEYFPAIPVFHSRDLVHWRQVGHAVSRPGSLDLRQATGMGGIFAPTIRHHAGWFYVVCTNVRAGGHFIVKARDPAGEWSDPLWIRLDHTPPMTFDPSLFFDDDGTTYFTYFTHAGIMQATIDPEAGKLLQPSRLVATSMVGKYPEGPHLYKRNGAYYLMVAEGGTEYGHLEAIGRSGSPWGPFEACPHNPILSHRSLDHPIQVTGHADLVQAADGTWWLVCLAVRPNGYQPCHHLGRESYLSPVQWTPDGWPVVGKDGRLDLEMEGPLPPLSPWDPEPVRDDFAMSTLDHPWIFVREPQPGSLSLSERLGHLRLYGQAGSLNQTDPLAFVGRRQCHFNMEVNACMEFLPTTNKEEAGLVIRMNENHHYEIFLSRRQGQNCLIVRRRIGTLEGEIASRPVQEETITLSIRADRDWYHLGTLQNGEFEELACGETRYLSSEVARGFTGVVIGMYATGNGKPCARPADFDWFDLIPGEE